MVNFPTDQNRTTIVGATGSGKTVFGFWLLSTSKTLDWRNNPVVCFDFKGEEVFERLEDMKAAKEISIRGNPPKKPGLYIVRPLPHEMDEVEQFLWKVWKQGNVGLFFDEGYMIAKSRAFNAILTQGRSKRIPCIILLQRPSWAPRFCFTEAQYFAFFKLIDKRDKVTVQQFANTDLERNRLPYHCVWYDVAGNAGDGAVTIFAPCPNVETILETFRVSKAKRTML